MKQKLSNLIFVTCVLFLIMGLITILKGDIENTREGMFMLIYWGLFVSVMLMVKWNSVKKLFG